MIILYCLQYLNRFVNRLFKNDCIDNLARINKDHLPSSNVKKKNFFKKCIILEKLTNEENNFQASMQEYRLRLLLLDRLQPTSSPPPTYRSNAGSYVAAATGVGPGTLNSVSTPSLTPVCSAPSRESRPPSYCASHRVSNTTSQAGCSLLVPSKKDANLVRIVQTESEPVILSGDQTPPVTAVEVLAHL